MPDWLTLVVLALLMALAAAGVGLSGGVMLTLFARGRGPARKGDE